MISRTILGAGLMLLAATPVAAAGEPVTVTISCGAVGIELSLCKEGVASWEKKTGNRAHIVSTPNSSTERLALYQQILAAGASDIDVLQIDVTWPGILAHHLIDLSPYMGDAPKASFPALIKNDTIDGKLVAMPWWIDAGMLYYRADLLAKYGFKPPTTWQELTRTARAVQAKERAAGHDGLWGFVWQGRAYEGLTCDALEWVAAFGGGTIVADDGKVTIANPRAAQALKLAASWVGHISPRGVLNYDEEASRGVFQSGNAVFMRNWPYAWALAQSSGSEVRGKVGVASLPKGGKGGKPSATLGGWHLAVSRYSEHPKVAAGLVRFLVGEAEQKRRAVKASYPPSIADLYHDKDVLAANPYFVQLFDTLQHAVPRPSRVTRQHYNRVSATFWRAVHDILAGSAKPSQRLARLKKNLDRIGHHGRW